MKAIVFPTLTALMLVGGCTATNNGMAANEMASPETPSAGVVPGQKPQ